MIWPDQSKYIGDFNQGKMEGKGQRYYSNGNIFDGDWEDDRPNGTGTLFKAADNTY